MSTKSIRLVLIIVITTFVAGYLVVLKGKAPDTATTNQGNQSIATNSDLSTKQIPPAQTHVRLLAMGDMLPHDTVNLRAKTAEGYDYLPFFQPISKYVSDSDIVFCNQESPSAGGDFGISGYPSFNAPTEFARDLELFGCNVINLANNHLADKGQAGIDKTLNVWSKLTPLAVGGANSTKAQQDQVSYFTIGDTKFSFIAFTDLSNNTSIADYSINMFSTNLVTNLATEAAANSDYVIASAHWGFEDSSAVSSTQEQWANLMADNGVDLIIGTGPHVIQPVDVIGDTTVIYSLGNFLSTQLTIEQLTGGMLFIDIPIAEGEVTKLSFLPTYMSYTWTPTEAAFEDLLARDNLSINPLDKSDALIKQSLFNTSAAAQITRISDLLNQKIPVEILKSD